MRLLLAVVVTSTSCGKETSTRPAPVVAPSHRADAHIAVAPPVDAAPPPAPTWRTKRDELAALTRIEHPSFDVPGGIRAITARIDAANRELATQIAALPDDAPDLPEAACYFVGTRRATETQLRRALAAATRMAGGNFDALYGSLRAQHLAVEPEWSLKGTRLEHEEQDLLLTGRAHLPAPDTCKHVDAGDLRLQLAELYSSEEHYPNKDPYTGERLDGEPTTMRGKPSPALAEIEALYRALVAAAPADTAVASIVEIASVYFCDRAKLKASVCMSRPAATARALAIRERALPASDPVLADTRVAHARLVARTKTAKATKEAEAQLRRVLAEAAPGAAARLYAALDLAGSALARGDTATARALEPGLRADLARTAGVHTWDWATVAETWADLAHGEKRDADAAAILDAAIRGVTPPNPGCVDDEGCDNRNFIVGLLDKQATYDPAAAPKLRERAATLHRELETLRGQRADEVQRLMHAP